MIAEKVGKLLAIAEYPGLGPFWGSIIVACVAFIVADRYTRHIKSTEATLEFSRRYQELLAKQHRLNIDFYYDNIGNMHVTPQHVSKKNEFEAWGFFRQFFDLMRNEFNYRMDNLVSKRDFEKWMIWRWYDWEPDIRYGEEEVRAGGLSKGLETCGVSYLTGWTWWAGRAPVKDTPFVTFMNELHQAESPKSATSIIRRWTRRWRPYPSH